MAEVLDVSEMLSKLVEPQRVFRWILQIEGIDAFTCQTSNKPQFAAEDTVVDYMNTKFYYAGKVTWEPLPVTFLAPILPSGTQKLLEWFRLVHEANTGRMGYKAFYQKNFHLKMLDPVGAVCESWEIVNAWPMNINFGELDYSTSDLVKHTVNFRYDFANLEF